MKNKWLSYVLIGLLLITNAVTVILYQNEKISKDKEIEELSQQLEEAEQTLDGETANAEPVNTEDLLILIADYDTQDATRIGKYLTNAGLKFERVGDIESIDVDKYDALIIPGGHSVTPSMYGAERDPRTKNTDEEKDKFQFAAVQLFIDAKKPILGICRGEQLVNNVFGGTTIQHMDEGWHKLDRKVRIAEGSWLYDLLGNEAVTYHYHHQCVDKLGEGLYATQWDPESGHIEAYEHKTLPVYGLQWHPDSMDEAGVEVFKVFGKTVAEYKQTHPQYFKNNDSSGDTE
ncbi:MAG: gamma-glutamyl-gamma-aminobutyrate hydrolase family protein [Clostridiales bacterium]|nr:gamma-glutamyl-gamma-aminobutyrate hydrolase family protein [Clostridiales bacterium]